MFLMQNKQMDDEKNEITGAMVKGMDLMEKRAGPTARYLPKKKNISASKFRKEKRKKQQIQEARAEKEKKRRKELEETPEEEEKKERTVRSGRKVSRPQRAATGRSKEPEKETKALENRQPVSDRKREDAKTSEKDPNQNPKKRQLTDARMQEYERYIQRKKKKKRESEEQKKVPAPADSDMYMDGVIPAPVNSMKHTNTSAPSSDSEVKPQTEATTLASEPQTKAPTAEPDRHPVVDWERVIQGKEKEFRKRKKKEKSDKKKSRRKKRRSRSVSHLKKSVKGLVREDLYGLKESIGHMPSRAFRMIADDMEAEQLAKKAMSTGLRMIARMFQHLIKLTMAVVRSVLMFLSPVLLICILLCLIIYIFFFSPFSDQMDSGDYEDGEAFPYIEMWNNVDETEIRNTIQTELVERQKKLTDELLKTYRNVRLISFAPTEKEMKDYVDIMVAMMKYSGVYPDDISTWLEGKTGMKKRKELAEMGCHILTDEELAEKHPELVPDATENETSGENESAGASEETPTQYVDKYMGYYSREELSKMGKLKEYEFFLH